MAKAYSWPTLRDIGAGFRRRPARYQDALEQRLVGGQPTPVAGSFIAPPPELTKHLPHGSVALLFRRVNEEFLRVQLSRGYQSRALSSIRLPTDGAVMRHFKAHPVPVHVSRLKCLPWFLWASSNDRDGLDLFSDSCVIPICDRGGLVGLLMMPQKKAHLYRGGKAPSPQELGQLAGFVRKIQMDEPAVNPDPPHRPARTVEPAALPPAVREVAHDLNNSLTTIVAHAYTLSGGQDPSSRGLAEAIIETALDGSESLKALARPAVQAASGSGPLVEVNLMVRTTLQMMAPDWRLGWLPLRRVPGAREDTGDGKDTSARLTVTLAPAGYVAANATEVRRALTNIILNALEALPSREGQVQITSGRDGRWAFIKVRDNGVGVPAGAEEEIFRRSVSTKGSENRGLGLAISKRVSEEHGGSLEVSSGVEAGGSTFTMRLPLAKFR